MGLETGNYIGDLNVDNPTGADPKSQGDNHLRLIKSILQNSMPGFAGAVIVGGVATGPANTYVLTPTVPLISYTANTVVAWKPSTPNTGASTLSISGLGARNILQSDGTALLPGDLSNYLLLIDTGTEYRILGVSKNYVDQLAFSGILPAQPIDGAPYELTSQSGSASWKLRSMISRSVRASNTQLTAVDQGSMIEVTSGSFTQTFATPTALKVGWNVGYKNSGSGSIELQAPAAVSTVSATVGIFTSISSWNVPSGLGIVSTDLVDLRRTGNPYLQRIIGVVSSYTANTAQTISSITNSGTTATLTTTVGHGRITGDTIVVSGATPAPYNGTFVVTVPSANVMTYTMLSNPGGNATVVGSYNAGATLNVTVDYRVDNSGISPQTISSITNSGTTATLTTAAPHGLISGNNVNVSGTTPAAYSGLFQITVIGPTQFSYVMASNPGGNATVVGSYTIRYADWTIATRPANAGIDGYASYLMYPNEERRIINDGTALSTYVEGGYVLSDTVTGTWIKPPGYRSHTGYLWAAGASGSKAATETGGGGGGACVPFEIASSALANSVAYLIGAGGLGQTTANTQGNAGGNSSYTTITSYGGGPGGPTAATAYGGSGGGALSAGLVGNASGALGGRPALIPTSGNLDGDYGGGGGSVSGGYSAFGGAGGGKQGGGGNSLYGGAGGGGYVAGVGAGGASIFGGNGGAGADAANGVAGTAPGGGGGGTRTGTSSGSGARGEFRVRGVI